MIPQSVVEHDEFLKLFPYRYDHIEAEHPSPGERPQWRTESRHPLHDRLILQGRKLYGVRFGANTKYLMIDLDRSGRYHPANDPEALRRILSALERLGLVNFVTVSSSHSWGLHLYFPFEEERSSFWLAAAVRGILCAAGIPPADGHLEIFPNPKTYSAHFKAHRLPLQQGSYILNSNFEPIWGGREEFAQRWKLAAQNNDPASNDKLKLVAKEHNDQPRYLRGGKAKFYADLQAEILPGWTGPGQTNHILGRIAIREYVFGHLTGDALTAAIAQVAQSLPGFEEWCRHKADLLERAADWAKAIENSSRYYPSNTKRKQEAIEEESKQNKNDLRAQLAQEKIKQAVASLVEQGTLPATTTGRRDAIYKLTRVSYKTLYKYLDLWHPDWYAACEKKREEGAGNQTESNNTHLDSEQEEEESENLSESQDTAIYPNKGSCDGTAWGGPKANPTQSHSSKEKEGGSGGDETPTSTPASTAKGAGLIAQIIQRIRLKTLQQKHKREEDRQKLPETIPDEQYFRAFRAIQHEKPPNRKEYSPHPPPE